MDDKHLTEQTLDQEAPLKQIEKPERPRVRSSKLEKLACWPEVQAMLESGDSIDEICTYIQAIRGEYKEVGHHSLRRVIYYWVSKHPEMAVNRLPTVHLQLESSSPNIDPLAGLNMILAIQIDRINGLYSIERQHKTYNHRTEREIRLANEILKTMAEVESKKKRYAPPPSASQGGSVVTQIEQLRQIYTAKYGQAVARVALSDESRRKVLNALEHIRSGDSEALKRILERNGKKAVELAQKEKEQAMDEAMTIDAETT